MTIPADPSLVTDRPGDQAGSALAAVASSFGMALVDVGTLSVPPEILAKVDARVALRKQVLPYGWERGVLQVAIADPLATELMDELSYTAGAVVRAALAAPEALADAIDRHYAEHTKTSGDATAPPASAVPGAGESPAVEAREGDEPVIQWVQRLVSEAWRRRASDIHVEPLERRLRIRYRIDGALIEVEGPPSRLQLAVVSRIKIMANLSIAEKRLPQDGRIQFSANGRSIDLRVSSLPTAHGESLVLRLLDRTSLQAGLSDLGMLPDHQAEFVRGITSPDGIMLVTGPTGSGKTTTLYAALQHLNHADRKIITVEEPVEFQLTGVNQVPVNPVTGMTFAAALRAMLRQAPNVVMVGEIRDRETTETALLAALTGHLVLSTLHTNDAAGAVTRLMDLGAKPFLVAAALRSVVAQRLVRRVCTECKRPDQPSPGQLRLLGVNLSADVQASFARGAGCARCHGTGYHGQVGLFEILPVTDALRRLIYDNVTAGRLRARAREDGRRTLREDGIRKVLAGLTTIEEVVSVTVGDPL